MARPDAHGTLAPLQPAQAGAGGQGGRLGSWHAACSIARTRAGGEKTRAGADDTRLPRHNFCSLVVWPLGSPGVERARLAALARLVEEGGVRTYVQRRV